jgi:hypothetical protein
MAGRVLAISVLMGLLLGSCGLPRQDQAEVIAAENVDYELLGTTTSTTSTTIVDQPTFEVSFYWHTASDNSLRQVIRGRDTAPDPVATLLELVAGPTAADLEENPDLQTRLDESMQPELLGPDDNGAVLIRIQRSAEEALTTDQAAEFVCTVAQFDRINTVTIVDAEDTPFSLSGLGAVPIVGSARPSDFGDCVEDPLPGETDEAEETTTTTG